MVVKLHALTDHAPIVRPARAKRQWMDDFPDRHAYRCLPLSIANAFGWEVLCPAPIEIHWNGGMTVEDIHDLHLKNGWVQFKSSDGLWAVNSIGTVSGQGRDYRLAVMTRQADFDTGRELTSAVGKWVFTIQGEANK